MSRISRPALAGYALVVALTLAACGGGGPSAPVSPSPGPATAAPTTTASPATAAPTSSATESRPEQVLGAGVVHTCTVTTDGGVRCWGWNEFGQLGDGTTADRLTPVAVAGLAPAAKAVAAGVEHSCAVTGTGAVHCWGNNDDGQLGDGTTTGRLAPVQVSGLGGGVRAVAAGYYQTCALTGAGGVSCWGAAWGRAYDDDGERVVAAKRSSVPSEVFGSGSGVQAVTAGRYHACVLTLDGAVKCWGWNTHGQLGDGTTTDRADPVVVVGLGSGVKAVEAGLDHTCAVAADGRVLCWGSNEYGQLGDGTTQPRPEPVVVAGLGAPAQSVAAGGSHTCAVTDAGAVKCWGLNDLSQLGDSTDEEVRPAPLDVVGLGASARWVSAGGSHTCAVVAGGEVKCWGSNEYNELGGGTQESYALPVTVNLT